ncbi:hypothetical protein [Paludisphaera mucosa]|uniref:Uncharacterized protein n=1 Tax=Paludisphaera mucosa TaxID=3030827 RepID=A0ABT6FDF9_9BACT|nr:hypothetical protein [Paludisphaera mucosa]MDG3005509.1 hypothetical protein [Paludisphaera mucosa]
MNDQANVDVKTDSGAPGELSGASTVEERNRLRAMEAQLKDYQRLQEAALDMKEKERLRALAEKGQIEEALDQQRRAWEQKHAEAVSRYTLLEQQVFGERKAAAIAEAIQGRAFVGETAEQRSAAAAMVRRLLQDEFETIREASGALTVRERSSCRPAAEALRERLDSPQFAIFFAPTSRGGAGGDASRPYVAPRGAQPGSLEAIVNQWRDRQSQYQSFGLHPLA